MQWAPKDASLLQQSACRKRILVANSCSRSFKVIHFAINYRPTTVSISLYNIGGLISEDSEDVGIQMTKNCCHRTPHSYLTHLPMGTPANIPINLIAAETRIIGLHSCCRLCGSISMHICAVGSKRRIFSAKKVHFYRSRSFKVAQGKRFWYQSKAHIRLPISD